MTDPTPRRPFTDPVSYYDAAGNLTTFKPLGRPMAVNRKGIVPPSVCARIVVQVDQIAMSMQVSVLRAKGELQLFEKGVYSPLGGRQVTVPGTQAILFNFEGLAKEDFARAMYGLGAILAKAARAPEAYVEVRDGEFAVSAQLVEPA